MVLIKRFLSIFLLIVSVFYLGSCGKSEEKTTQTNKPAEINAELTEFELENGIGPVKEKLELDPIDPKLVKRGEEIFNQKCVACHKLDERYVGPAQRDLIKRRTPEFIMNMMLNPEEMEKRHPEVIAMLKIYLTPMPNQNLTYDDARALLDFFRDAAEKQPK